MASKKGRQPNGIDEPVSDKEPAETVNIYVLKHPVTGEVRYVGKANNANARLKSHIRDAMRRKTPVYKWINSLMSEGLAPIMEVIRECTHDDWEHVEKETIASYRTTHDLLNVADGGAGPYKTREQKAESGRSNAKALHSDPRSKRIWELKRAMGQDLKFLRDNGMAEAHNRIVAKLKIAAMKCPRLFGGYLSLTEM